MRECSRIPGHTLCEEALEKDIRAAALAQMLEAVNEEVREYLPTVGIGGRIRVCLREGDGRFQPRAGFLWARTRRG